MLYEVLKSATGLEVGETYTPEDLAVRGDVNNMVRKGIVRPVGFLSAGSPLSDSEAARTIAELQGKLEAAEDERDQARKELKEATRIVGALKAGHEQGARQLADATQKAANLEAELAAVKSGAVLRDAK